MRNVWQEVSRLQGIELVTSTAYHPQIDEQTKALNRCLEMHHQCFVVDSPYEWFPMLPWAEYWYNTTYQTSAGMTPFQVLMEKCLPQLLNTFEVAPIT